MLGIIALQCVEINDYDGWSLVSFQYSSTDPTIFCSGNMNFTITDATRFVIGAYYDLNLEEISI